MELWVVETVAVAVTFGGGLVMARAAGFGPVASIVWAFFVGTTATITIGSLQVMLMMTTSPVLTWVLLAVAAAVAAVLARRSGRDLRVSGRALAAATAVIVATMVIVYVTTPTRSHIDSVTYMNVGALLARDTFHDVMPNWLFSKRLIGMGIIHAPSWLAREFNLPSVTPLLMLSVLGIAGWLVVEQVRDRVSQRMAWSLAAMVALAAISFNRMLFSALLINAHVLVAGCLLVLVGLAMVAASGRPVGPLVVASALAIPAMIVSRPDGALYAAVAVLPFLLVSGTQLRHRVVVVASFGLSLVGMYGYIVLERMQDGVLPDDIANAHLYIGVAALLSLPLQRWSWPRRHGMIVLLVAEFALWAIALDGVVRDSEIAYRSAAATWNNIVLGRGGWPVSLVMLAVLAIIVTVGWRARHTEPLRYALTSFVPLALILMAGRGDLSTHGGGGAYRVGPGDSLNRSLAHIVLIALVYVVVRVVDGRRRDLGLRAGLITREP